VPRRATVVRREVDPDPRYQSALLAKFINNIMMHGKKSKAQRMVYKGLETIEVQARRDPLEIFESAIRNATPMIEVKPRRVGGATYQVPVEIQGDRRQALAFRWLIQSMRSRTGRTFSEKVASELLDAAHGAGAAVKRKEDTHRMAEANRAFSHYRW
jgi:small subunit ribosomal protein S7